MPSTHYTDLVGPPVRADWLNDVNKATYETIPGLLSGSVTVPVVIPDGAVTPAKLTQPLTLGTAKASTSGTSIDFTGIPSWAKRVTVMLNGVSTTGSSPLLIQIGSGSFTTTGYTSVASDNGGATAFSNGFGVLKVGNAAYEFTGHCVITAHSGTSYIESGVVASSNSGQTTSSGGGSVSLSAALDRIRVTTVNGTDTFDAGTINIMWE